MIRKGIRPRFRFGPGRDADAAWRREFPFKRPWPVIAVVAVLDVVFLFPAIATARQIGDFGGMDSLFDLVGVVFLGAWLLGWSLAPLVLTAILLLLLLGREVVSARPGTFRLDVGLPFAGFYVDYDVGKMRNLRLVRPADASDDAGDGKSKRSGHAWRGDYIAFDYGSETGAFGSRVEPLELGEVESGIQVASGKKNPPRGSHGR